MKDLLCQATCTAMALSSMLKHHHTSCITSSILVPLTTLTLSSNSPTWSARLTLPSCSKTWWLDFAPASPWLACLVCGLPSSNHYNLTVCHPGIPLNELVYAMKYPQGQLPNGFILETTNVVPLLAQHLPGDLFFVVQVRRLELGPVAIVSQHVLSTAVVAPTLGEGGPPLASRPGSQVWYVVHAMACLHALSKPTRLQCSVYSTTVSCLLNLLLLQASLGSSSQGT